MNKPKSYYRDVADCINYFIEEYFNYIEYVDYTIDYQFEILNYNIQFYHFNIGIVFRLDEIEIIEDREELEYIVRNYINGAIIEYYTKGKCLK